MIALAAGSLAIPKSVLGSSPVTTWKWYGGHGIHHPEWIIRPTPASIKSTMARGSAMILDNLGIRIKLSDCFDRWARVTGKDELNEQDKRSAVLQEVLQNE